MYTSFKGLLSLVLPLRDNTIANDLPHPLFKTNQCVDSSDTNVHGPIISQLPRIHSVLYPEVVSSCFSYRNAVDDFSLRLKAIVSEKKQKLLKKACQIHQQESIQDSVSCPDERSIHTIFINKESWDTQGSINSSSHCSVDKLQPRDNHLRQPYFDDDNQSNASTAEYISSICVKDKKEPTLTEEVKQTFNVNNDTQENVFTQSMIPVNSLHKSCTIYDIHDVLKENNPNKILEFVKENGYSTLLPLVSPFDSQNTVLNNSLNDNCTHNDSSSLLRNPKFQPEHHYPLLKNITRKSNDNVYDSPYIITRSMRQDLIVSQRLFSNINVCCPYPNWLSPQLMVIHDVIECLNSGKHGVIESPTGTGKTLALLCASLAWQMHQDIIIQQTNHNVDISVERKQKSVIFYCTRTHSQISQIVSELKKTPYRPFTICLGSSQHFCPYTHPNDSKIRSSNFIKSSSSYLNSFDLSSLLSQPSVPTLSPKTNSQIASFTLPPELYQQHPLKTVCRQAVRRIEKQRRQRFNTIQYEIHQQQNPGQGIQTMTTILQSTQLLMPSNNQDIHCNGCPFYAGLDHLNYAQKMSQIVLGSFDISIPIDSKNYIKKDNLLPDLRVLYQTNPFQDSLEPCKNTIKTLPLNDSIWDINTLKSYSSCTGSSTHNYWLNNPDNIIHQPESNHLKDDYIGCPYYTAQTLAQFADIIILPYQFLLNPFLLNKSRLPIDNAVILFDEGHNIEQACRDEGSGSIHQILMTEFLNHLTHLVQSLTGVAFHTLYTEFLSLSHTNSKTPATKDLTFRHYVSSAIMNYVKSTKTTTYTDLLYIASYIFVELQLFVQTCQLFVLNHPKTRTISSHDHVYSDSTLLNTSYLTARSFLSSEAEPHSFIDIWGINDTDSIINGCLLFFKEFQLTDTLIHQVILHITQFQDAIFQMTNDMKLHDVPKKNKVNHAIHIFSEYTLTSNYKSFMKSLETLQLCLEYKRCYTVCFRYQPRLSFWDIELSLMVPAPIIEQLTSKCRCLIVASGTLSPVASLLTEFGASFSSRVLHVLQTSHVISKNQLMGLIMPSLHHINGTTLSALCTVKNLNNNEFLEALGHTLCHISRVIPGGVLIFFPSYRMLERALELWRRPIIDEEVIQLNDPKKTHNTMSILNRLSLVKGKLFIELKDPKQFPHFLKLYKDEIKHNGTAIVFGVFRGKLSEGFSMRNEYVRGVICIGIPYPNITSSIIQRKKKFNDQLRQYHIPSYKLINKSKELNVQSYNDMALRCHLYSSLNYPADWLSGNDWYTLQAYRPINQAIGRVIRHQRDFGIFILIDSRHLVNNHRHIVNSQNMISPRMSAIKDYYFSSWLKPFFEIGVDQIIPVLKCREFFKEAVKHYSEHFDSFPLNHSNRPARENNDIDECSSIEDISENETGTLKKMTSSGSIQKKKHYLTQLRQLTTDNTSRLTTDKFNHTISFYNITQQKHIQLTNRFKKKEIEDDIEED